jgi:hypothetical protein
MTRRGATTAADGTTYTPGATFRVVRAGAQLTGWVAVPGASQGWVQALAVGDVLTCTGFGPGIGADPGFGVEFTTDRSEAAGAFHCEFRPSTGGACSYHPAPGYLEPVAASTVQSGGTT